MFDFWPEILEFYKLIYLGGTEKKWIEVIVNIAVSVKASKQRWAPLTLDF